MQNKNLTSLPLQVISIALFRSLGAASGLLMTIIITNSFSVKVAGEIFLSVAIVIVMGQVLTFGGHNTSIRLTGRHYHKHNYSYINNDITSIALISTIFGLLSIAISYPLERFFVNFSLQLPLIVAGGFAMSITQTISGALIGLSKQKMATILMNGVTPITACLLILAMNYLKVINISPSAIYPLCTIFTALVSIAIWLRQKWTTFSLSSRISEETVEHLKSSYPILLSQLCVQYSSQFATAIFLSPKELAYFTTALRISMLVSFVLMAANLVVAGRYAKYYSNSEIYKVDRLSLSSSRALLLLAVPVGVLLILFPNSILKFFGEEYISASLALQILIAGQIVNVLTGSVSYLLSMCGQEKFLRKINLISLLTSVIMAYSLTPLLGIYGASLATAIALAFTNLMGVYYVKKQLGFNTLNIFRSIPEDKKY